MSWFKQPQVQRQLGAAFLVLATAWKWFVHPNSGIPEAAVDGVCGFLYGVAIALMLVSLRRKRPA
ncbi:MAG: hypothetical protein ACRENS_08900 [Candidatus Eiseniibacteriota bacterium]